MDIERVDKILILFFTQRGSLLAEKLEGKLNKVYRVSKYNGMENKDLRNKISDFMKIYSHIVFISSTGIAVRYIADHLKNKQIDPSVTVLSDDMRFTIPLIGSHLAGGITIAKTVSEKLKNTLVTTTASDNLNIIAPDTDAFNNDYKIVNYEMLRLINSLLIKNKKISNDLTTSADGYILSMDSYSDIESYIDNLKKKEKEKDKDKEKYIDQETIVETIDEKLKRTLLIVKKPIAVGIGCRKGKEEEKLMDFLLKTLEKCGKKKEDVKYIATCFLKKDEEGIINLAKAINARFIVHENEDIKKVQDNFKKSNFVKEQTGVYNVSSSSCYLIYKNMILEKEICNGMTMSVSFKE